MDLDERIESVKSSSALKKYWKWILLIIIGLWAWMGYNGLVKAQEPIANAWGNVETEYQSRADKVKVISKIVKSAANFEYTTLVDVVKARQMKDDLKKAGEKVDNTAKKIENFKGEKDVNNPTYRNLQNQLTGSLGGINVVFERYPELKATEAYRDFQAQYEGIENRIAKARRDYNKTIETYNKKVRKFPRNLIAKVFGFDVKEAFKADEGAENIEANDIDISLEK
ncbi:MAG: LemA family protein [Flavobacteriales bacterium]